MWYTMGRMSNISKEFKGREQDGFYITDEPLPLASIFYATDSNFDHPTPTYHPTISNEDLIAARRAWDEMISTGRGTY